MSNLKEHQVKGLVCATIFCAGMELAPAFIWFKINQLTPFQYAMMTAGTFALGLSTGWGISILRRLVPENAEDCKRSWYWQSGFFLLGCLCIFFEVSK